MKRVIVAAAVLAFSASCAQMKALGIKTPDAADTFAQVGGDIGKAITFIDEAKKLCDPLKTREVSVEEEYEMGGAVALNLAMQSNGGVFIEVSPDLEKEPAPLDTSKWGGKKKVKVPTGDKVALTQYMNRVGRYLAAGSERPGITWTFVVLDSPEPNAFSAPGGYVFITTGLLKQTENEAQLAGVLAHEVGHVTGKHSLKAYQEGKYVSCYVLLAVSKIAKELPAVQLGGLPLPESVKGPLEFLSPEKRDRAASEIRAVAGGAPFNPKASSAGLIVFITDTVGKYINATGFAQDDEFAADAVAMRLMVFNGYNPAEFEKLLSKLPDSGNMSPHPKNADRVKKLQEGKKEFADFNPDGLAAPDNKDELKLVAK